MYICEVCNYKTVRKQNLNRHFQSKKHQRNITRVNIDDNTNENENNKKHEHKRAQVEHKRAQVEHKRAQIDHKRAQKKFNCKYCDKIFTSNASLKRHIKKYCKVRNSKIKSLEEKERELINKELEMTRILNYKDKELESKDKEVSEILESKNKILESKNKILENQEKYKKEIKDLQNRLMDTQKDFIEYAKDTKKNSVSNIYYIQNNFKNAMTMNQVLDNWNISYHDMIKAGMKGFITGCTELIDNEFIKDKSIEERPIHCLDISRGVFMYHDEEIGWVKHSPSDLDNVITNIDNKFCNFNRDYQEDEPKDETIRKMKEDTIKDDIGIYHVTLDKMNEFIPAKYKRTDDKDSDYTKSKKKIIKNIALKCAFTKPNKDDENTVLSVD